MTRPTYALQVDLSGNGSFGDPNENVTSNVIGMLQCSRGRDFPSPLTGRARPGELTATLLNTSGNYSTSNPASMMVGQLNTGRAVRLLVNGAPRWSGYLTNLKADRQGNIPVARLEAKGALDRISEVKIFPPASAGALTGTIIGIILDAAGWPVALRMLDAGQTTTSRWFVADIFTLGALREIEETELGLILETKDGKIGFQGRQYRLSGARIISQAMYSDAPAASFRYLNPIMLDDGIRDVVNRVTATVTPYTIGSSQELWRLTGETPILAPGEIRTWYANPSGTAGDVLHVDSWVTPILTNDIIVTGVDYAYIGLSVEKLAKTMKVVVQNTHPSNLATFTTVRARGTPVTAGTPTSVQAENLASQAARGLRSYPLPAKWLPNTNVAQDYTTVLNNNFSSQQTLPRLRFNALLNDALLSELMTRDLSDRVTIVGQEANTALGLAADFFVEEIRDYIDFEHSRHDVEMAFSPATLGASFWVLGSSVLGVSTVAGY